MRSKQAYLLYDLLYNGAISLTITSYIPYLQSLGLSPSDVSLVNFGYWTALLACELPTGIFADRYGHAHAVRIGTAITALFALLYSTASGLYTAFLYEMGIGIGLSFVSGALSAWIREALERECEEDQHTQVVTRTAQYRAFASVGAGLIGGLISMWSFRLVWFCAGCIMLLASGIALRHMRDATKKEGPTIHHWMPLRLSWQRLCTHPELRWAVMVYLLFSFVLPFNHYWAPYFRSELGELGQTILWVPMYLSLASGAFIARRYGTAPKHHASALCIALILTGVGLAAIHPLPGVILSILALILHEMGRGFFLPMLEIYTQSRIESAYRATYSSLQSLLARTNNLVVLASVWTYTADLPWNNDLIGRVWGICGGALTILALLLWKKKPTLQHTPGNA